MNLINQNLGTIAVLAVLFAVVVLVIVKMVKDKKAGKSFCGCSCDGCALKGQCRKDNA